MGDEQAASSAAPKMPLDLSLLSNEQDYLSASKCNYFLQLALKNKDTIAAKGNRKLAQVVEDFGVNIVLELYNINKEQADEVAQATKNLKDLGRSQREIDSARAYLEGHSCPGIATHQPIRSLVRAFDDKAKSILGNPATPGVHVKPVPDRPGALSSASPLPTPSVVLTNAEQLNNPATAAATRPLLLGSGSSPNVSAPASGVTPATASITAQATATTSSKFSSGDSKPMSGSGPSQPVTNNTSDLPPAPPGNPPPKSSLFGSAPSSPPPKGSIFPDSMFPTPSNPPPKGSIFPNSIFPAPSNPPPKGSVFPNSIYSAPSNPPPKGSMFPDNIYSAPSKPSPNGSLFGATPSNSSPKSTLFGAAPSGLPPKGSLFRPAPTGPSPKSGLSSSVLFTNPSQPTPSAANSTSGSLGPSASAPVTQPTKPIASVSQPTVPSTQSATEIKKRSNSPEASVTKAGADTKRARYDSTSRVFDHDRCKQSIRIGQLDSDDRPIQIDNFIYVFRCPERFFNDGDGDGINAIDDPIQMLRHALRNGSVAFRSVNTRFNLTDIPSLLAYRVIDAAGRYANANQIASTGGICKVEYYHG